jgi:hypothetical protein
VDGCGKLRVAVGERVVGDSYELHALVKAECKGASRKEGLGHKPLTVRRWGM